MDIRLGKRTIPLYFSTFEMVAIQREVGCTAAQLRDEVFGLKADDEDPKKWTMDVATDADKIEKLGKLLAVLGNAGLEEAGEEPDLNYKWVLRHMNPKDIVGYAIAATATINEGLHSEVAAEEAENQEGPKSVIVMEEERKKQPEK